MQSISQIRALLDERGLRPKKSLGQNFLHDHNQLRKLIEAARIEPGEIVLEVGPGTGTLTEALLDAGARVVACELDDALVELLHDRFGDRIRLIHGDALESGRALNRNLVAALRETNECEADAPGAADFKLVANLPYQVASPLMASLLIEHDNCLGQFVTIQKEVADRLVANPGTKAYGPLGIIVQAMARVEMIGTVPPSCFWPLPRVTSAMVALLPSPGGGAGGEGVFSLIESRRAFARFIHEIFSKRRKQLGTILGRDARLPDGVAHEMRPETLAVEQLIDLWQTVN